MPSSLKPYTSIFFLLCNAYFGQSKHLNSYRSECFTFFKPWAFLFQVDTDIWYIYIFTEIGRVINTRWVQHHIVSDNAHRRMDSSVSTRQRESLKRTTRFVTRKVHATTRSTDILLPPWCTFVLQLPVRFWTNCSP